ncbi:MAG: 50S ribosomal protein L25 [Deltaproteobacteria bacterium]|uniref:Large ribosomal subunit protein bL25 n=1 Tax=Candidatus Zymogenus saltonus TaxID=2844893 RepID=A0A9D8KEB5_9DELT|nr:50S ribosomal protein L25 [Candidatus Zymogenus saltonus]
MEIEKLKISTRESSGKGAARKLRGSGMVPGIIYGYKTEPLMIKTNTHDLKMTMKGLETTNPFFNIIGEDEGGKRLDGNIVILKELQVHPLTREYLHIDLHKIDMEKELTAEVPIHFVGKPQGVKMGGILQEIRRQLEISALPADIPEYIEVDVSELNVGDSIHLGNIQLPKGCQTDTSVNYTIVIVVAPKLYEEAVEEELEAEEAAAEGEGEETTEGEAEGEE